MSCASPLPFEVLVAYWAGDVDAAEEERIEEHLFSCEACSRESARVAAVTESVRDAVPPLLSPEVYAALLARGLSHLENRMMPGERKEQPFPPGIDLLVHRLGGLHLEGAERVSFRMTVESSKAVLMVIDDAPFDRDGGAVLVACQRHYAVFPPDTVAEVRVHGKDGTEEVATYTILHEF